MKTTFSKANAIVVILGLLLTACGPAVGDSPSNTEEIQVVSINEGAINTKEFTQTKVFDQCQSSSPLRAGISFNEIIIKEAGEELIIGGSLGGEVGFPQAAKITLQGSIQKHYSEKSGQSLGHQESIDIEVPANTKQQYNIIWVEYRQQGSVDYTENGDNKSVEYSYRTGVELASSSVQALGCPSTSEPLPEPSPTKSEPTPIPMSTPIPTRVVLQDTPAGTILDVGQTWRQSGVELTLLEIELHPTRDDYYGQVYTSWRFANNTPNEIILSYSYQNFSANDNLGNRLKILGFYNESFWCDDYSLVMKSGDIFDFSKMCPVVGGYQLPVVVNLSNKQISEIIVTATGISSISDAKWRIPIFH